MHNVNSKEMYFTWFKNKEQTNHKARATVDRYLKQLILIVTTQVYLIRYHVNYCCQENPSVHCFVFENRLDRILDFIRLSKYEN